ncbi:MAG: RNase P modulator RnpM [Clostridia bacterium]
MKLKKIPQRTCLGCGETKPKQELIRIVRQNDGSIFVDKTGKANGRGAYICNNIECLEKAIKSKRLDKNFKIEINNEIYESLRGVIIGKERK